MNKRIMLMSDSYNHISGTQRISKLNSLRNSLMDILSLARQVGFHELESEDIEQVLASHTEELTNEDLQLLTEQSAFEDSDDKEEPQ
ncbi:putative Tigger transposable element-derived protein 1-like 231 [Homarus americanus]|uniref:Putative Tigger transposable element-derived protein 1-like 231 n=1 Tax=Homarus americanus TaxID=6706 RepID=A0A8J5TAT7_HOMAM|nr:putative Tigger transposable element-derived protein 1-like 231 [Homarus americanus]